jgi:flavin-dependent dehydrogenase
MESSPDYEVVILGGGPAGCATALALVQHRINSILIVEAGSYETVRIGESIPPDCRLLLEKLGVWGDFLDERHEPCLGSCSSWGEDAVGYNDFLFNPHGNGWHLDRRRFDSFLARRAARSGARLRVGTMFDSARRTGEESFELRLATGEGVPHTVRTRFVVDATGSHSRFARSRGARQLFHDRLSYVAAFLEMPASTSFSRLTLLEAVDYGWWYAARLPCDRLAVGVASDPEIIKQAALHTKESWLAHLRETRHLSSRLADSVFIDNSMVVRTAPSFVLDNTCGSNWLAVGDAASAYDPISSQGIYKALLNGLKAAEAIATRLEGDTSGLGNYNASIATQFADYLKNRNYFYGLEQRWPSSPFWRRRRERTAAEKGGAYDESNAITDH